MCVRARVCVGRVRCCVVSRCCRCHCCRCCRCHCCHCSLLFAVADTTAMNPLPGPQRSTTIADSAREVRCSADGTLEGATVSDHGYVILSIFFNTTSAPAGEGFQDEHTFADHCEDRKQNGYNSGMGEIFRRVAAISPVQPNALPAAAAAAAGDADAATGNPEGQHDEF